MPNCIFAKHNLLFHLLLHTTNVCGVATVISPPVPLSFFLLILSSVVVHVFDLLNLLTLAPTDFNHSWAICPPFLAVSPFVFCILCLRAKSDQLTLVPSG